MVSRSASAFMCAAISTRPLPASWAMAKINPCASKRGAKAVPAGSGPSAKAVPAKAGPSANAVPEPALARKPAESGGQAAEERPPPPRWLVGAVRIVGTVVAVYASVLMAIFGAFLTPFRIGGVLVPVALLIAIVAPVAIMMFARYVAGGALPVILAGIAWVVATFPFANRSSEGDIVLSQQWVAVLYLFLGPIVVAVVCYRMLVPARRTF